jgi:hypothetical protein
MRPIIVPFPKHLMKKKLIDAVDIHQTIVLAFHLFEDALSLPGLALCQFLKVLLEFAISFTVFMNAMSPEFGTLIQDKLSHGAEPQVSFHQLIH